MGAAPSIVGRTVVNLIACGLAVSGIVSLADARVCSEAGVAANGLSMTVVFFVSGRARIDLSALEATATLEKRCPECAGLPALTALWLPWTPFGSLCGALWDPLAA